LEELRLVAHEEHCERLIEIGRHAEAVADLQGLIADQPLREQFIALEMRALYLSGRQAEALRTYRRFADYLADETGLDPSDMLVDLEHRILIGDPSLAPSSAVAVPGYELGDLIGEGAFGAVYRAVQPSLGREVAIKAVRAELADDPRFVHRFETEAQLVARLEHPHVVPLYDFWRQPGAAFLVFRLLRGGSLADRIGHGPLGLAEVSRMVEEIGGALAAAHALGIVHRDVKPANVLFDEAGNSYLADFGIAITDGSDREDPDLTLRSAGSPLYASPEQARDGVAGQASDQYSLAVIAWEALTGRAPFAGATATEVLRSKLAQTLPTIADALEASGAVDAVLQRASAPIPIDRYRDVTEFVHAWVAACAGTDAMRTTGGVLAEPAAFRAAGTLAGLALGSVNPYKGLRAFREADAAEFRGRSELVGALVERVDTDPFVLVVGPSGSGKSSLVHAGAVPVLREHDALVVSMVPSVDPFVELEAALRRVATSEVGDIGRRLLDPAGLAGIAADIVTGQSRLVLVIDQFEELWTLVSSAVVRDRFAACISSTLANNHDIRIIATLRADLYDRPLQHALLGPIVRDSTFAVTTMTSTELHDAIALPAERAGVRFQPGLVATMIGDVVSRPGALPLLQFALTELFEQRINGVVTNAAYTELGGIGGAIARRAEQLYDDTPPADRTDVRLLFTQLVTPGDDNDNLRRRANRDELGGVDPSVIDRFLAHRLLVTDVHPVTREPTVEVAHEALLREWPRLSEWIDEDRDVIRLRRALRAAAHEWHGQGRDEGVLFRGRRLAAAQDAAAVGSLTPPERKFLEASHDLDERERTEIAERSRQQGRQNRRLRRLLIAVAAVLVVALVAGFVAVRQRNRADAESAAARAAQVGAERAQADAVQANAEATAQAAAARQANAEATAQGAAALKASADAITQKTAAERAADEALGRGLAAQSATLLSTNENDLALLLAVESQRFADRAGPDGVAAVEAHDAMQRSLADDPLLVGYLNGQPGAVQFGLEYSPDGRHVVSGSDGGELRVWDADTRQLLPVQPEPLHSTIMGLAMSNTLLATSHLGDSTPTTLWDVNAQAPTTWQPPGRVDGPAATTFGDILNLALSRDGVLARSFANYYAGPASTVEIWDTNTGHLIAGPIEIAGTVDGLAFSPDGTQLAMATISPDNRTHDVQMVDARTGTRAWHVVAHPGSTTGSFDLFGQPFLSRLQFSVDGSRVSSIVSRSTTGAIATLDASTGSLVEHRAVGQNRTVLAASDDLRHLLLSDDAGSTQAGDQVVDAENGNVVASFTTDSAPILVRPFQFRPNSTEVVFQNTPGALTVRDWARVGPDPFVSSPPAELFGPTVTLQANGDVDDLTAPLRALGNADPRPEQAWSATPSATGQVAIATASTIEIWDPGRNEFVRRLRLPPDCVSGVSVQRMSFEGHADDGRVVAACNESMLMSWDLTSSSSDPQWIQPWTAPGGDVGVKPLLSPDRTKLLVHEKNDLQLFDASTGALLASVTDNYPDQMVRTAFSPDGSVVAVIAWSGNIDLLRASDLSTLRSLTSRDGALADAGIPDGFPVIAISPDNEYVATWHWKIGVEIWNAATGASVALLDGRRDYGPPDLGATVVTQDLGQLGIVRLPSVALSFDGDGTGLNLSVVQGYVRTDGTAFNRRLSTHWSIRTDDMTAAACRIVGRDLTEQEWKQWVGDIVPYHATCTAS
jgi:WD40 repeat protein/tRNA A-37 threonylcarbamoyl transferase component Bud32/energy-coupling factor transporter ATP-binding protein EcfA2